MNQIATKIKDIPLGAVRVTDAYCVNAARKEISYLLSLQEGRLLAGFYENAGLKTPFVRYGGWESGLIGGHTLGHYLTAVAQGYASAGVSAEEKALLLTRVKNIVDGLALCQEHSQGDKGFLWGAPFARAGYAEAQFDNVEKGKTDIKREAWVPWYTMHKLLAGLLDAYRLTGYERAAEVAGELGDWVYRRAVRWDTRLRNRVLSVEYGGMNDCLYELYSVTGRAEHAVAAHIFDEEKLFAAILSERKDALKDKHANTMIPKVIGALKRYLVLHGKFLNGVKVNASRYLRVAAVFWKTVVERHTYVTGGNSEWEHFGEDYVLDRERTNCNCETCNVYNMLKLSRLLFCITGDKRYTDYYDNAFVNSILSSQNPDTGMTTYFQPMAGGFFKVYSRPYDKFWCCTGTGMENFTKLGDSAFYSDGKGIYVEQYLSSELSYGGVRLVLQCDFPLSDRAEIEVKEAKSAFSLFLRIPEWAAGELSVTQNGRRTEPKERAGHLCLRVKEGDRLSLTIPVTVTLKGLPDGDALAFRYGGAVLSARLGKESMEEGETGVDVTIPKRRVMETERVYFPDLYSVLDAPERFLVRRGDSFTLSGGDIPLSFGLHYRQHEERYAIYLRLREGKRSDDSPEWQEVREAYDCVQPGYGQYETDELHEMKEKNSVSETADGSSRYARAGGYFCYELAVDPSRRCSLSIGLLRRENGKTLKVTVCGEKLYEGRLNDTLGEDFYRKELAIPAELIARNGRKKTVRGREYTVIDVRFEGSSGKRSARVAEMLAIYCE